MPTDTPTPVSAEVLRDTADKLEDTNTSGERGTIARHGGWRLFGRTVQVPIGDRVYPVDVDSLEAVCRALLHSAGDKAPEQIDLRPSEAVYEDAKVPANPPENRSARVNVAKGDTVDTGTGESSDADDAAAKNNPGGDVTTAREPKEAKPAARKPAARSKAAASKTTASKPAAKSTASKSTAKK